MANWVIDTETTRPSGAVTVYIDAGGLAPGESLRYTVPANSMAIGSRYVANVVGAWWAQDNAAHASIGIQFAGAQAVVEFEADPVGGGGPWIADLSLVAHAVGAQGKILATAHASYSRNISTGELKSALYVSPEVLVDTTVDNDIVVYLAALPLGRATILVSDGVLHVHRD